MGKRLDSIWTVVGFYRPIVWRSGKWLLVEIGIAVLATWDTIVSRFSDRIQHRLHVVSDAITYVPWYIWVILAMIVFGVHAAEGLRKRVKRTEAVGSPSLEIELAQISGLKLGHQRDSLAYLTVNNVGAGKIENAYIKAIVIEHEDATGGGTRPFRRQVEKHQELFLKWESADTRLHSFITSAKVRVAYGRAGSGFYLLEVIGGSTIRLRTSTTYEIVLEIAADNVPVLSKRLLLSMAAYVRVDENGQSTCYIDSPFEVEFREWTTDDDVTGELDLDALEVR